MNKNINILFILLSFIFVIIIIKYLIVIEKREINDENFEYVNNDYNFKNIVLLQNPEFYRQHYDATLKYLLAVYPKSENLKKLNYIELAQFYNSLWMYYNCEASYKIDLYDKNNQKTNLCWQELPGCGEIYPKLPYTPQGCLYSFSSWIENDWQPFVYSDSINLKPFQITSSVPGQTFWKWYNGPAPVWMYQRTIFRMVFNANSPTIDSDGFRIPSLIPGDISQLNPEWKYPSNWWLGQKDYGYVEITAASEPGLAPSPPICWYDGWCGSGQFLNVGRSLIGRNKVDAVWKLVNEMKNTKNGSQQLIKAYGSNNPYQVCWNLVNTRNNKFCKDVSGPILWNENTNSKIQCLFCFSYSNNNGSIPNNNLGWYDINYFNITDSKTWCGENNIDTCVDKMRFGLEYMPDRQSSIMTFDEPLFFLGQFLNYDTIQMTNSANGNGFWQYEICELRDYPINVKNRDYSDFIAIEKGKSCPSIVPESESGSSTNTVYDNSIIYRTKFITPYIKNISKYITLRDPLDIDNESSTESCINLPWNKDLIASRYKLRKENTWEYNLTCQGNLSKMFNKTSIFGGPDNQCLDGIGFGGKLINGNKYIPPYG